MGKAVRAAREQRGWSQEHLAEVSRMDRTYVSGLERGTRNPSLSTLQRLAAALDLPLADLVAHAEHID